MVAVCRARQEAGAEGAQLDQFGKESLGAWRTTKRTGTRGKRFSQEARRKDPNEALIIPPHKHRPGLVMKFICSNCGWCGLTFTKHSECLRSVVGVKH